MASEMSDVIKSRVDVLTKARFFRQLSKEQLIIIAELLKEESYNPGDIIFKEGDEADAFYIIKSGQVEIRIDDEVKARLARRDVFGEIGLIFSRPRTATVVVMDPLHLFALDQEDFDRVQAEFPSIATALKEEAKVRKELGARKLSGKHPDEHIAAFERRHPYVLLTRLLLPLLLLAIALISAALYLFPQLNVLSFISMPLFWTLCGLLTFAGAVGVWWVCMDWANDWYIVTNERVIHIEEIKFIFYERREIDLDKINTTRIIKPPIIGRFLNIGTLIIRTASVAGAVVFDKVYRAERIREQIDYQSELLRDTARETGLEEERQQIRELLYPQIGLGRPESEAGRYVPEPALRSEQKQGCLFKIIGRLYKPAHKTKKGDVVWHKHWHALARQTWHLVLMLPLTLTLALVFGYFAFIGELAHPELPAWGTAVAPLVLAVFFTVVTLVLMGGFLWRYADWQDDAYIVSNDSIIYIENTPFGLRGETRVDVEFRNIQDISSKKGSVLAQILDFGDVVMGTASKAGMVTFKYVAKPEQVQFEILRRMKLYEDERRRRQKREQRQGVVKVVREYDIARFKPLRDLLESWREQGYTEAEIQQKLEDWLRRSGSSR